jgi:molecular chaperone HscC
VTCAVFQGESRLTRDNIPLGEFTLTLQPRPIASGSETSTPRVKGATSVSTVSSSAASPALSPAWTMPVIERNTLIPVSRTKTVHPCVDDQRQVTCAVFPPRARRRRP